MVFKSEDGPMIKELIDEVLLDNERKNRTVHVTAYCPDIDPNEVVAEFELTISLRNKTPV